MTGLTFFRDLFSIESVQNTVTDLKGPDSSTNGFGPNETFLQQFGNLPVVKLELNELKAWKKWF